MKREQGSETTVGAADEDPAALAAAARPRFEDADLDDAASAVRAPDAALLEPDGGFWVFAYGSLIWDPGFPFAERRLAEIRGFARGFCLWSLCYRGTPAAPGLVLGLAARPDAETRGVAYRVAPEHAGETRAYLADRELVSAAYQEVAAPLRLIERCGRGRDAAMAVTYVCDPGHKQFAGGLDLTAQAAIIADSVGPKGPNAEYLFNTVSHLRAVGLSEADIGELTELERSVRALLARKSNGAADAP